MSRMEVDSATMDEGGMVGIVDTRVSEEWDGPFLHPKVGCGPREPDANIPGFHAKSRPVWVGWNHQNEETALRVEGPFPV